MTGGAPSPTTMRAASRELRANGALYRCAARRETRAVALPGTRTFRNKEPPMRFPLAVAALAVISPISPAPGPNVTIGQGGGAALQQAVNAAAPGDVLDVLPGTYSAVTVAHGLRFELRPGVQVVSGSGLSAFSVTGLPANEACVVHGGQVQNIWLTNCTGPIAV